ncbi:GNAT family N-acetyltransferase [Paenibacillus selenitireducens]|uniref:GNAT family N-acetyltransferase n=1 Tax=Paenibacillus selenitireducens TaxID=1324314 RepID=A0A1T2WZD7_9BACL|nr:GNAT family N-acetyltransferase [Paenibacillus selenitireducens]OPA72941.1 GNAT family N-acetyltransferase [Paenibacillus selenitireducens]
MDYFIEIVEVAESQKSILRQLIEFYEYDFSEFNDADINEHGFYGYKYFDHYWTEDKRQAYFVKVDGQYAGFVLVNDHCYILHGDNSRSISEFFIMRKYRRKGIGERAAKHVFDKHVGSWEVLQHGNNSASQEFWRNTINEYTHGIYNEHDVITEHWTGKGIIFINKVHSTNGTR